MSYYYDSLSKTTPTQLGCKITEIMRDNKKSHQELIILCIGSDRSTGDSLGPIIGYKLKKTSMSGYYVYGDLEHPVHAGNLSAYIAHIKKSFYNPYIIAIDASLGRKDHVGLITLGTGPVRPGMGVKKKLPEVGDLHITGIVNTSTNTNHLVLQTTRLSTIMQLADTIFLALNHTLILEYDSNDDFYKLQSPEKLYLQNLTSLYC
ncbi:MAG: spore protease YyaC [Eubacteriales bacterium]|nr:spore protease YyaC [Eubacteriales bacterium]